jgi:HK97 family phage prohead protease
MGWMHSTAVALGFAEPRTELADQGARDTFAADQPDSVDAAIAAKVAESVGAATWMQPVTREFALQVPAVLRGRNVICSAAQLPLRHFRASDRVRVESSLLNQIDPNVPNLVTLAQTFDDLIFHSVSWWQYLKVDRDGFPINARHLDFESVSLKPPAGSSLQHLPSDIDPAAVVWVDGKPADGRRMIRFDSPNPALLVAAKRAIRRAALLDAAAAMYAENPRALEYFTPTEDADPEEEQIVADIRAWVAARRARSVGYVPSSLKLNTVEAITPADLQLVQLQARASLDIANALGLDPEDLGVSTTSRTYNNATDRRREKLNDTFGPYMRAIVERLSMNDVTRRGYVVEFDLTEYLKADPLTQANVASIYHGLGAVTVDEVRADIGKAPLEAVPAPAADAATRTPQTPAAAAASHAEVARYGYDRTPEGSVTIPATFSAATAPPEAAAGVPDAPSVRRVTFAAPDGASTFKVDAEKRTISGLAVPYGEVTSDWRQISFAPGSVDVPANLSRVKVLLGHDDGHLLGVMTAATQTDAGLFVTLRISQTQRGDEALALANDGALDGLSVGVDIHTYEIDTDSGVTTATKSTLRETSLTPFPAFDSARVDKVNLTSQKGTTAMTVADPGTIDSAATPAATPSTQAPAPETANLSREDVAAIVSAELSRRAQPAATPVAEPAPAPATATYFGSDFRVAAQAALTEAFASMNLETRETVNPNRETAAAVREPLPYVFDRGGNLLTGDHDFSSDIVAMGKAKDQDGSQTDAGRRVMALLKAAFATATTDVDELNPAIQRPDMYVDQKDYRTPLWDIVNKGALPNGVQPFTFPKFASASGLVGDHTEGTEPTVGSFVTTGQTINPTGISGKAEINREVWDMGGNPQTSGLIWNQMRRGWREGLESATATFLNTLTAAVDITITAGAADDVLADVWDDALAELQFTRGYDYSAFAVEKVLYKRFTVATDSTGRRLFPILNGMNNNGSAAARFRTLDLSGVTGVPAWALASTSGAPNNSWLFDPMHVHGWATPPQELTFDVRVKSVDIGIFGYKAFANSDIAAVRQVIYDLVP